MKYVKLLEQCTDHGDTAQKSMWLQRGQEAATGTEAPRHHLHLQLGAPILTGGRRGGLNNRVT